LKEKERMTIETETKTRSVACCASARVAREPHAASYAHAPQRAFVAPAARRCMRGNGALDALEGKR
jgi:hypothetical protein